MTTLADVRALREARAEAERLKADLAMSGNAIDTYVSALAAERKRFAALVADLRALPFAKAHPDHGMRFVVDADLLHAVIDRHAPATPTTED